MSNDDTTQNARTVAPPDPRTKWKSRRWLTGIGTAAALWASQFVIQGYLAVAKEATMHALAWYFFAMYALAAGVALGYITAKTYRDVVLAKIGVVGPGAK